MAYRINRAGPEVRITMDVQVANQIGGLMQLGADHIRHSPDLRPEDVAKAMHLLVDLSELMVSFAANPSSYAARPDRIYQDSAKSVVRSLRKSR